MYKYIYIYIYISSNKVNSLDGLSEINKLKNLNSLSINL